MQFQKNVTFLGWWVHMTPDIQIEDKKVILNNQSGILMYIFIYIHIYLDLPKGAKWFLKGVNSPSLRV